MFRKFFLILSSGLLMYSCQNQKQIDISYTISPTQADAFGQLKIAMNLKASPNGETILEYPDSAWGEEGLYNALKSISTNIEDASIQQQKDSGWIIIKHPKRIENIVVEYVLEQDFAEPISTQKTYRPIIQPEYFHIFSHNLFMLPKSDEKSFNIQLKWDDFPQDFVIHNSFGSQEQEQHLEQVSRKDFANAIFVGGDFRIYEDFINGNKISLATRGNWIPFKENVVFEVLKKTLQYQRDFWGDHSQEYFTVTLQPFPQETGSSFQGTGLTNSFATSVSNNEYTDIGQLVYLFNHELMHNWIGGTIQNENEEEQYWFSEGFTEYYTFKNVSQSNIQDFGTSFFLEEINRTIQNLYASPVKNEPNSEINYDNFWANRDYGKLAYYRGALFAFCVDMHIKMSSEGKFSLDDVMLLLLEASNSNGQKLNKTLFLEKAQPYFGNDLEPFFERYIVQGHDLPLQDLFEELGLAYTKVNPLFELGFEWDDKNSTVSEVKEGSNAQKAGLLVGDRLGSTSIWYGETSRQVELTVIRNGNEHNLSFFPVKMAELPQLEVNDENWKLLNFTN